MSTDISKHLLSAAEEVVEVRRGLIKYGISGSRGGCPQKLLLF